MSYSLWSHGLQHTRLPCPSPTPGVYSNSYPSSWWCHQTISPSVIPSPLTFNISQNQGLLQWVSSSRQVAKLLELQLKHQCFQWIGLNNTYIHVSILLKLIWSNIIPLEASLNWLFKTYCMSYHVFSNSILWHVSFWFQYHFEDLCPSSEIIHFFSGT